MTLLLTVLLLATPPDTIDVELRRILTASVRIEVLEGRYVSIVTDSLPEADPAAPLVNGHRLVFDYLLTNAQPPQRLFAGVEATAEPEARTRRFIENVLGDSATRAALAAYYQSLHRNPAPLANRSPETVIPEARALTIASRFFHPARIVGDTVQIYRCAGINGLAALGSDRDLLFEAFAFESILYADSAAALSRDYEAARNHVQRYAGAEGAAPAALQRAQADMYRAMAQSEGLRTVLRSAYMAWHGSLPFRVPEWGQT